MGASAPGASNQTLFPRESATDYGDWIKAGALKIGDRASTLSSLMARVQHGPTLDRAAKGAANDNETLTVADIRRHDRATRVYNLSIESRPGEITHNYLVGDELVWVHNVSGPYKCQNCGARHGGVYCSDICHSCYGRGHRSQDVLPPQIKLPKPKPKPKE